MYESPQKIEQSINQSLLKLIIHNNYKIYQRMFLYQTRVIQKVDFKARMANTNFLEA